MMPGMIIGRGFGVVNSKATPQLSTWRSVGEKSVPDVLTVVDIGVSRMSAAAQVELLVVAQRLRFESSILPQAPCTAPIQAMPSAQPGGVAAEPLQPPPYS